MEPMSTSASTITRPPTMCRPPAKRSRADSSALRELTCDTVSLLSSSFTSAVIATRRAPFHPTLTAHPRPCAVPRLEVLPAAAEVAGSADPELRRACRDDADRSPFRRHRRTLPARAVVRRLLRHVRVPGPEEPSPNPPEPRPR